jgi:predicted dehydrogenase
MGIIGAGNVLEAYVPQCEKLRGRGLAELIKVCGRAGQKERALALGAPKFTTSEIEILEDAAIDLVILLTSMPDHARAASAALRAGKHVLLEKPLATTLDAGRELLKAAQSAIGTLVCAPFTTLSPTFQTMARRIAAGDIGKPHMARARYGWAGPWWAEWFYKPGGGCLFDLGIYPITSLTGLLGPARRVTAFAGVAIPEREINGRRILVEAEDNAQLLIDFGGCYGAVMSGFTMQQYRNPAVEIYGGTGTIQMLGDDWDPEGYEIWQNAAGCWQVFKETAPDWPWSDGLRHFVECLHAGKTPIVTKEHAFHVLEIILKAQQSAKEGRALTIESSFTPLKFETVRSEEPAHLAHDRTREHLEL